MIVLDCHDFIRVDFIQYREFSLITFKFFLYFVICVCCVIFEILIERD